MELVKCDDCGRRVPKPTAYSQTIYVTRDRTHVLQLCQLCYERDFQRVMRDSYGWTDEQQMSRDYRHERGHKS